MRSTTNTGDGEDNKIKGSKQKIFQLKEELNGGHLGINPKFEKLKVLRESYDIAKFRANELLQPHEQNLYIKVHGQRASKIYSALSTLIFLSISTSKVEELEHYIKNAASQVPSSIFDLEEWSSIVKIAKDCREGDYSLLQERSRVMRKNMQIFYQLAVNPLRTAQMELKLLKSEINNELSNAKVELASSINLVMQIIAELQSTGTVGENAEKLGNLIREHSDTAARSPVSKQKDEELLAAKTALQQLSDAAEQVRRAFASERAELQGRLEESTAQAAKQASEKDELASLLAERDKQVAEMTSRLQQQESRIAEQEQRTTDQEVRLAQQDAALEALKTSEAKAGEEAASHQQAQLLRDFEQLSEQHRIVSADLERREDMVAALQQELRSLQRQHAETGTDAKHVASVVAADAEELRVAKSTVVRLQAELDELRHSATAPGTTPIATAEERASPSAVPAPLTIALHSEEDELLSLIAAEAIHAASVAVSEAAGKLVASLNSSAPAGMQSAVTLQSELLDSIIAHHELLSRSGSLSSLTPREMETISGILGAPTVSDSMSAEEASSVPAPTEEEFVMSLISAEAIHTASLAVTAAAAKLVAGLAVESEAAPAEDIRALQVSLVDTLAVQGDVLRSPNLGEASPPAPPAEEPSTPSRVHFRTEDSVREISRYININTNSTRDLDDYCDRDGFDEANDEEEDVLSLIYAEAMHTASVAVMEAAARLVAKLTSASAAPNGKDQLPAVLDLQETLADKLVAHTEVLLSPQLSSLSSKIPSFSSPDLVEASAKLKTGGSPKKVTPTAEGAGSGEELVLSLISAEAIHTASAAVTAAAANLLASLSSGSEPAKVGALHAALADSLAAHSEAVSHPQMVSAKEFSVSNIVEAEVSPEIDSTAPEVGTGSSADGAPVAAPKVIAPSEKDVIMVQNQLRSFNARAKVRHVREEKEAAKNGDAVAIVPDTESTPDAAMADLVPTSEAAAEPAAEVAREEPSGSPKSAAKSIAPSEKDVIMVQNQLRGFNARAKVNRVRAEKEAGKQQGEHVVDSDTAETASNAVSPAAVEAASASTAVEPAHTSDAAAEKSVMETANAEPTGSAKSIPKAVAPSEKDIIMVQNQLRGFNARAKVRHVREEKEAAKQGEHDPEADASADTVASLEPVLGATTSPIIQETASPLTEDVAADQDVASAALDAAGAEVASAGSAKSAPKSVTPSEKDIIMVQNQLRGFNARAKVNRVRAEKEAAKHGDPAAAAESAPEAGALAVAELEAKATIPPEVAPAVADSTSGTAPAVQGTVDQPAAAGTAGELAAAPKLVGATEEEVVIVQNQLRGFIARAKVRRVRAEKEAAKQGVLSATKGTVQGEPGWYKTNDQLFYFCMDKKEYVLLGGPMDDELYEAAANAEKTANRDASALTVDRIGVRATRLQIDSLTAQVTALESQHAQLLSDLEDQQLQSEVALEEARAETQKLVSEIAECRAMLRTLETERRRSLLGRSMSEVVKAKSSALSFAQAAALIKLTSVVRGFLGRVRFKRIKTQKLALEVGILSAMPNTIQGQSGWYMGPNRAIFYFVLKNREWINIAGPVTAEDYELMLLSRKQKQLSFSGEVLTRCTLDMVPDKLALLERGEIYLENVTDKLYLCTPLDSIVEGRAAGVPKGLSMDEADAAPLFPQKTVDLKGAILVRQESKSLGPSMPAERDSRPVSEKVDAARFDADEV